MVVRQVEGTGIAPKWRWVFFSILPNAGIHFHQQERKECVSRMKLLKILSPTLETLNV